MTYVLRCQGYASGAPCPATGMFLAGYDPEYAAGRGLADWTWDVYAAVPFPTPGEALRCWTTIPRSRWLRDDGQANRPLTAYTVEVLPLAAVTETDPL